MTFNVAAIIKGSFACYHDDGTMVYDEILPYIEKGKEVILDFESIDRITIMFLNGCIGKLYMKYGEKLDTQIFYKNYAANLRLLDRLNDVIKNATT